MAGSARKAPAAGSPAPPASTQETISQAEFSKAANDVPEWQDFKKKVSGGKKIYLKKPNPKQSNPGNWKDSKITGASDKTAEEQRQVSPASTPLDPSIAAAFPSNRPMEDNLKYVHCKHCKRTVVEKDAKQHIEGCIRKKQEKVQKKKEAKEAKENALRQEKGLPPINKRSRADDDDDDDNGPGSKTKPGARKQALKTHEDGTGAKKTKKRRADDTGDKAPKAKKNKIAADAKKKVAKTPRPVDVERQCGVVLPNGLQCARSLTCKSHSMGAKRAVPGRSLPYDILLQQYQKKNQAKLQRAAMDANAPLQDEFEVHGPVDSEDEKEAVMAAVARSTANARPIVNKVWVSTREKYQHVRMKEMLASAMSGTNGSRLFATRPPPEVEAGEG